MEVTQDAIKQIQALRLWLLLFVAWFVLVIVTGQFAEFGMMLTPLMAIHYITLNKATSVTGRAASWTLRAAAVWLILLFLMVRYRDVIRADKELLALWMLAFGVTIGVLMVLGLITYTTVKGVCFDVRTLAALREGLLYDEQLAEARARDGELVGRVRERLARRTYGAALYAASEITHPDLRESVELMIKQTEERHKKEKKP